MKVILAVASAMVLAGCQMSSVDYAYKTGGTVAQKDRDSFDCELAATRQVPTNSQIATTPTYQTPTYYTPLTTNCYGNSCTTSGGTAIGGQVIGGQTFSYDANASLRTEFFQKCMASKGYRTASVPVCPSGSVAEGVKEQLGGQLRSPVEGSCVVSLTKRSGNLVYPSERK